MSKKEAVLYVLSTPIGNLEDLSARAERILRTVTTVFAEDTRITRRLLSRVGASPRLFSCHQYSGSRRIGSLMERLCEGDAALVTDAGSPGISDPGPEMVRAALKAGHTVRTVPGACSISAALSISGFDASRFLFLGFLPKADDERRAVLIEASTETGPIVIFEAPHRLRKTLETLDEVVPDRLLSISREMTKLYEETFSGDSRAALEKFTEPRGEFVIVVEGMGEQRKVSDAEVADTLRILETMGFVGRSLIEEAAKRSGTSRSHAYRIQFGTK